MTGKRSINIYMGPSRNPRFAICIRNDDHPASLEKRKIYEVLPDEDATRHRHLRVVDESGEDYLFPEEYFVDLPKAIEQALARAV